MTSKEFTQWMAYYTIEPFGEERADLRIAMFASALINVVTRLVLGNKARKMKIEDFMPFSQSKGARHQTQQEQIRQAKRLTKLFGGTIIEADNE